MPNQIFFRVIFSTICLFAAPLAQAAGSEIDRASALPDSLVATPTENAKTSYSMNDRIQSAEEILQDIEEYKKKNREIHERTKVLIAESRRLKGEAAVMQTKTPILPQAAKLSASQYQAAVKQYHGDLDTFANHAKAYDAHLRNFQATIGECHANDKALESVLKKYELHVDQFHIPNQVEMPKLPTLRPPHVCGRLQNAVGDLTSQANAMYVDQQRLLHAQLDLAKAQGELTNAETNAAVTRKKAETEAKREAGEQALAAEFSQLKGEYDLLKVERQTLAGNSTVGKVSTSTVSATVKKK